MTLLSCDNKCSWLKRWTWFHLPTCRGSQRRQMKMSLQFILLFHWFFHVWKNCCFNFSCFSGPVKTIITNISDIISVFTTVYSSLHTFVPHRKHIHVQIRQTDTVTLTETIRKKIRKLQIIQGFKGLKDFCRVSLRWVWSSWTFLVHLYYRSTFTILV